MSLLTAAPRLRNTSVFPRPVERSVLRKEYPLSIVAAALFIVLALFNPFSSSLYLSRVDGIALLAVFTWFLISTIRKGKRETPAEETPADGTKQLPLSKGIILAAVGLAAVIAGGQLVVNNASEIAASFGVSQTLIGLTIVAIGTSLPELVTSIAAALKGETDIAVGNVIGSNIFNILMVLGIAAAISPVAFLTENIIDIAVLIVFSVIGWIMAWTKRELNRKEGIIMLLLYAVYVVYICMR